MGSTASMCKGPEAELWCGLRMDASLSQLKGSESGVRQDGAG